MNIAGLQKLSTIDYPGRLSAVVFTNGCNYDCWYCHNRQLIDATAENIPLNDIIAFLKRRQTKLSGLVIGGGEPTLQKDLPDFIRMVKDMGYHVKLDTNGSNPEMLACCLGLVDYVAIDYKAPKHLYNQVCGYADYDRVRQSILLLGRSYVLWEVRTTLAPEIIEALPLLTEEINALRLINPPKTHRLNRYRG
jgi:pyruvate formate lyase activating enzyme